MKTFKTKLVIQNTYRSTTFLLTFLMCFLLHSTGFTQWSTESPVPTDLDVGGMAAPTENRIFLATDDDPFDNNGALFESTDRGDTWVQRNVPINLNSPLNGIFFLDSQRGWTYGNNNYRTLDGGTTWTEIPFLGSTYFMEFYTPDFGIASGNFGIQVSIDGGLNWSASPNDIFRFDFFDAQNALGVSASGLYGTTDGGSTISLLLSGDAKDATYLSANTLLAIVDDRIMRSTNSGSTWIDVGSANEKSNFTVLSETTVLAWGTGAFPNLDNRVFRSADGGATWTDIGTVMPSGVLALTVLDTQNVVGADKDGNMYLSIDGGATWSQTFASPGPRPGFFGSAVPVFPTSSTGYFAYGHGFAIKSTDGGNSWSQISSGVGQAINDIARFDDGRMIAVGDEGTILTTDGNGKWQLQQSLGFVDIEAVDIISAQEIAIIDNSGQVHISGDGGASWQPLIAKPSGFSGYDLQFSSPSEGWVIGSGPIGGALLQTIDGGATWTGIPGFGGLYVAVDFEGPNGWAVNVGGPLQITNDNGQNWFSGTLPGSPFQVADIDFYDEATGYVVGWGGYAARSNDGGLTWEELPTQTTSVKFSDIYLLGPNEIWLSTLDNLAYYSANGGQNWAVLQIGSEGFGNFSTIVADTAGNAWTGGFQGYIEHFNGPPPPPLNRPPAASFTFNTIGLSVDFTDTSNDPDGTIISWFWEFGDGTTSTERNPSHTFAAANTYLVRLTVVDDDGDSNTTLRAVVAQPGPGGTFGAFTEVTPIDSVFVTPQDEDFWVITTAPADFDLDGDLDIAVLGFYVVYNQSVDYRLLLLQNNGSSTQTQWDFEYISLPFDTLTSGASDMAWGDVDNDNDPDLVVGTNGKTILYRNDAGSMVPTNTLLPGYWEDNGQAEFDLNSISWADYDNDGDADLLLPSVYNNITFLHETKLMRNDGPNGSGGWIFTEETNAALTSAPHAQSFWADYDGDQDLDLLLINIEPLTFDGFIRRYRNDGNGFFTPQDIIDSLTIEHGAANWGDYDADGDLDILIGGNVNDTDGTYKNVLRIYQNDNDVYSPIEIINCIPCEGWFDVNAVTWADYDNDGDVDILLGGTYNSGSQIEGRARIYENNGGVFSQSGTDLPAPRASGTRGGTFSWLDIDGEGDLDYFIAGQYFVPGGNGLVEAQMHLYRNDSPGQNLAPTPPNGLSADVQPDSSVVFTWNAANDDHTPAAALTYELKVSQNGTPISTAYRLPEPGNVGATVNWLIDNLEEGSYVWSIQSVDAAFLGSAVASGSFTIGNPTGIGDETNIPNQFTFFPNYPNPFNPSTTFRFSIPERTIVNLKVYDINGRLVQTLVNQNLNAGEHNYQWNASGVASGTYFVRLSTSQHEQTQRVLLLK
ncbi:MAG: YCF48-related protein [Calditrichia bacterium]